MISDEQLPEDRYHCGDCDVTFRDRYPEYYDVTPCPYCREMAGNVFVEARQSLSAPGYC